MDPKSTITEFGVPPEASRSLARMRRRIAAPVESFLQTETASGFLLLGAAAVALLWANSPWGDSYESLWHTPIGLGFGDHGFVKPLHFWINDFLMTFFFMVAGFEIKREIAEGELSDLRRAALPIGAAVGGMLVPAALYFGFNPGGDGAAGWGIPMATDIAFALGILSLLGSRVPAALRILLLAIAIIDDLGAILVIAIFYSSGFDWAGAGIAAGGLAMLFLFYRLGFRPGVVFMIPLLTLFAGLYMTGIHPTIAGVIVGISAPVRPWLSRERFIEIAERSLAEYSSRTDRSYEEHDVITPLRRLSVAGREAVSPVSRLEQAFHPWVAFVIMPLFALANAGVDLGEIGMDDPAATGVALGVAVGLALGKPVGVLLASWLLVKLRLGTLPRGVTWSGVVMLGLFAGIGFTMSIFIAGLAFPGAEGAALLGTAKLAILAATGFAAVVGLVLGRFVLPDRLDPEVAKITPREAESSTEY